MVGKSYYRINCCEGKKFFPASWERNKINHRRCEEMTSVQDIPPGLIIEHATEKLKGIEAIKQPEWSRYVKTGVHKEKPPVQDDWWYTRIAAILRTIYLKGPIGVSQLRSKFGGKKNRGSMPSKARKGSGKIIRVSLQQLEDAKFIEKNGNRGRILTSQGRSFLDNVAHEVLRELVKEDAQLGKF